MWSSSLLAAAGLTLLAYAVSQPLVALDPSPAAHAIPVAHGGRADRLLRAGHPPAGAVPAGRIPVDGQRHHRRRVPHHGRGRRWSSSSASPWTCCWWCWCCRCSRPGCGKPSAPPTSTSCGSCTTDDDPPDARARCCIPLVGGRRLPARRLARRHRVGRRRSARLGVLAAAIGTAVPVATGGPLTAVGGLLAGGRAQRVHADRHRRGRRGRDRRDPHVPAAPNSPPAGTDPRGCTQHSILVQVFLAAMALAVLAASLGVLWVAIEATTVVTAFLVGQRRGRGGGGGRLEVRDDLLHRDRAGPARHVPAELRRTSTHPPRPGWTGSA